jgi:outer membrane protein OmpA-like peptidoglycan-associated protein
MILNKKILLIIIALYSLISCSFSKNSYYTQLHNLEPTLKTKRDFESFLALEYLSFANKLIILKNKSEANYFSKKGLNIINGKNFFPENPLHWKSDKQQLEELIFMQKRLENITSTPYLKFNLPIQLAHTFYLYDCWVAKESQPVFRGIGLSYCRENFAKMLNELEIYFNDSTKERVENVNLIIPEFARFSVQFDKESFVLNEQSNKTMITIIDHLLQSSGYKILLVGNADNSAVTIDNQNLLLARITTIKNYLIKNGVHSDLITQTSEGEDFPDLLSTNPEESIKQNRSVAIYVLKGNLDLKLYPLPLLQNLAYRNKVIQTQIKNELNYD